MPCPECNDTCWTFVDMYVQYLEEPYSFQEGSIHHEHDSNPRISTWRCSNGHEFQRSSLLRCKGCIMDNMNPINQSY